HADSDGDGVDDGTEDARGDDPLRPDQAPFAVVRPLGPAVVGEPLELDGSWSFDPQGAPLTHGWTVASAPAGAAPVLHGAASPTATLVPDAPGVWTLRLEVHDGAFAATTTTQVTVLDPI